MNKVNYYETNTQGRDLIVGDLHGCLEDLLLAMKALNFNESVDRMFSVGDLVDRGPNSFECAELIYRPWFHATRGNHEDMMILSVLRNDSHTTRLWQENGGHWIYKTGTWEQLYPLDVLTKIAKGLDALPLVIVVGEGESRFNIVHAEFYRRGFSTPGFQPVLSPVGDKDIDTWTFSSAEETNLMWGRNLIRGVPSIDNDPQKELSQTFVGHTPVFQLVRCFKHIYIDIGCVYHYMGKPRDSQALAIACPQEQVVYSWSPAWKKLTSTPFAEIPTIQDLINKAKTGTL